MKVEPNNDEVICPNCVTQFRAIPVNVQTELAKRDAEIAELKDSHSEYMRQYTSAYNQQAHNYRHLKSKFSEHLKQHTKDLDDASDALENAAKERDALKAEMEQLTKKYEALQQAYGLVHGGSK